MKEELLAIRAAVTSAVQSAWPGIPIILGDDETLRSGSWSAIQTSNVRLLGVYPGRDEYAVELTITGAFERASGDPVDQRRIERAGDLHDALTASSAIEEAAHLARVTELLIPTKISPLDNQYEVQVRFECQFETGR